MKPETRILNYQLTDEQHEALWENCDAILEAPPQIAYLCFVETFEFEPTNSDLHDFCILLEVIKAKKTGVTPPYLQEIKNLPSGLGGSRIWN